MPKSPTRAFRMAPLQRLTVRPIDNPAEQAALDERLKRCVEVASEHPLRANGSATGYLQAEAPRRKKPKPRRKPAKR